MVGQSELEYVQAELAKRTRDEWVEVADGSGVPFSTVKKIGYKQTPTPRSDTVGKLAAYFHEQGRLQRQGRSLRRRQRVARMAAG